MSGAFASEPAVLPRAARIADLIGGVPGAVIDGDATIEVRGIRFDSRLVAPGDLFAALVGADFNGHRYAPQAVARGAAALLVERRVGGVDVPQIVVANSRAALAPISAAFFGHPSRELRLVGLTGTDGKTTTSYILDQILRGAGQRTGLIGTVAIKVGPEREYRLAHQTTPESCLVQGYLREMVEQGVATAILEATSHGLAMHRLDGTRFTLAGVTNITHEHLEYHKTIDAYRRAKALLIERVAAEGGVVVLNADDEGARSMSEFAAGADVRWYSLEREADLRAREINARGDGTTFVLDGPAWGIAGRPVRLRLIGVFNVANALCAACLALAQGIAPEAVIAGLERAEGVPGRMNRIDAGQPFQVVVDYAHTPESLRKILTLLRRLNPGGHLIVVSGSAGERDPSKRPLQGAVCAELADLSIFTSEDPRNEDPDAIIAAIAAGAREAGGIAGVTYREITDRREAIGAAFAAAEPGDCVLLAGKGHETSMIWGYEHRPWDEAAVARAILADQGYGID